MVKFRTADNVELANKLFDQFGRVALVAKEMHLSEQTVKRMIPDRYQEQCEKAAREKAVKDQMVIELRRAAKGPNREKLSVYAKRYGLTVSAVEKAIRGTSFTHLNEVEPPVVLVLERKEQREQARKMYGQNMSLRQIAAALDVANSSVSNWCHDLIQEAHDRQSFHQTTDDENRQKARDLYRQKYSIPDIVRTLQLSRNLVSHWCRDLIDENIRLCGSKNSQKNRLEVKRGRPIIPSERRFILTDDQVVEVRKFVKANPTISYRELAKTYGTSESGMSLAIRGLTHRRVNRIEAPCEKRHHNVIRKKTLPRKKPMVDENLAAQLVEMRREDATLWTLKKLAQWMKEQTGRSFQPNHVALLIKNRNPEIGAIVDPKPVVIKPPKPPKPIKPPRIKKVKTQETSNLKPEKKSVTPRIRTAEQKEVMARLVRERRQREREEIEREKIYTQEVRQGLHGKELQRGLLEFEEKQRQKKAA